MVGKIKYIHEPDDLQCGQAVLAMLTGVSVEKVAGELENEIKDSVKQYVPNVEISNVSVLRPDEDPHSLYLAMTLVFHKGKNEEYKQMVIKL